MVYLVRHTDDGDRATAALFALDSPARVAEFTDRLARQLVRLPAGNVRRGAAAGDTPTVNEKDGQWFALVNPEMAAAATDLGGIRSGISAAYARPLR
ncbi:hypothetical protein ACQKB2_18110 [Mycobacterium tuberculosis]